MYFIPIALFIKYMGDSKFFETIQKTAADFPHLTWGTSLSLTCYRSLSATLSAAQ